MTIRLCLRISRTTEESTSLERQELDGRAYAERRWPGVPIAVYSDDGVSGATEPTKREGLGTAMREWQAGDILLSWKLDRLARSLFVFVDLMRAARADGVAIVTVEDHFDLSTPAGELQASILAVVAQWERENVRTRVRNTRRHLNKVGRWPGGRAPYGLRIAPHPEGVGKTLERDPEAAEVIRRIVKALAYEEKGLTAICRDLNTEGAPSPRNIARRGGHSKWSESALRTILESPHLVGHQRDPITQRLVRDEEGLPLVVWEPIVSEEDQAAALDTLKPYRSVKRAAAGRHWLYGVATCGDCGHALHRQMNGETAVLRCLGTQYGGRHDLVTVRADALSTWVVERVSALLGAAHIGERVFTPGTNHGADLERLRAFLDELQEDRAAGIYNTEEGKARFRQQYGDTAKRIEELEAQPSREAGWSYARAATPFGAQWAGWTDEQRGAWLREAGATVSVKRPEIPRTRVPLSQRCRIDLGELNDVADAVIALEV